MSVIEGAPRDHELPIDAAPRGFNARRRPLRVAFSARVRQYLSAISAQDVTAVDRDLIARRAQAGWAALETEIARCRRHHRSFVLLAFRADDDQESLTMLRAVESSTRLTDYAWLDAGTVYVLLPESTPGQATVFVERLRTQVSSVEIATASIGSFPDDAITLTGLLEAMGRQQLESDQRMGALAS